jgi:hypothetical protein
MNEGVGYISGGSGMQRYGFQRMCCLVHDMRGPTRSTRRWVNRHRYLLHIGDVLPHHLSHLPITSSAVSAPGSNISGPVRPNIATGDEPPGSPDSSVGQAVNRGQHTPPTLSGDPRPQNTAWCVHPEPAKL